MNGVAANIPATKAARHSGQVTAILKNGIKDTFGFLRFRLCSRAPRFTL